MIQMERNYENVYSESILMVDEEKKGLIEIMDENGSWIFRSLSEKGV